MLHKSSGITKCVAQVQADRLYIAEVKLLQNGSMSCRSMTPMPHRSVPCSSALTLEGLPKNKS
jgi:hypothetical protein